MRIAIVHERLDVVGGAEKVILALHELYPDAPIYTSFVDYDKLSPKFREMDIRTSYMQKLPKVLKDRSDKLLPFYMLAFQDFDLSEYDLVISSSYVAAKSIITPIQTCHICYCYTPLRFAWDMYPAFIRPPRTLAFRLTLQVLLQYFRMWDVQNSNNVDFFIAISDTVRQRIRKHYRRESIVIYPPVQTTRFFENENPGDFYLAVSRLVPYKMISLAVEAFNTNGRRLVVIGNGREYKKLAAMAKDNVEMLGWQPDDMVARYLSEAKGLIFPGEEDFGILPVEAQAAGTPVIAFGRGGASETVVDGKTGIFFRDQTVECLNNAVEQFEKASFDRRQISIHARRFDQEVFKEQMHAFIQQSFHRFRKDQLMREEPELESENLNGKELYQHAVVPRRHN